MAKCFEESGNSAKAGYFYAQTLPSPDFSAGMGRMGIGPWAWHLASVPPCAFATETVDKRLKDVPKLALFYLEPADMLKNHNSQAGGV